MNQAGETWTIGILNRARPLGAGSRAGVAALFAVAITVIVSITVLPVLAVFIHIVGSELLIFGDSVHAGQEGETGGFQTTTVFLLLSPF